MFQGVQMKKKQQQQQQSEKKKFMQGYNTRFSNVPQLIFDCTKLFKKFTSV